MKKSLHFFAVMLLCVFGLTPLSFAQIPPAEALVLGGVKLGDTKPMVLEAAKKLGLSQFEEVKYDAGETASIRFVDKTKMALHANYLIVQFSPLSQKVVGINRGADFNEMLPHSTVYKATVERFGKPKFDIGVDERNIAKKTTLNFPFNQNGAAVNHIRCDAISLPQLRYSDECSLGISVSNRSKNNSVFGNGYWDGQDIIIIDSKTLYKEFKEIQDVKDQASIKKRKDSEKLAVPRF